MARRPATLAPSCTGAGAADRAGRRIAARTGWTIWISFTNSRMLPSSVFVGLRQYSSLIDNERWQVSVQNLAIFGCLFMLAALALGFLLAVLIDQRVRGENLLRSVFLYPFSMSFIVTGLAWRWLLDPTFGIEKIAPRHRLCRRSRSTGWCGQDRVIYTLVARRHLACVRAGHGDHAGRPARHRSGDLEGRRASTAFPPGASIVFIIVPMLRGSFATAVVLLATSVVRLYDLSVAMTNGGPGIASEVPAKFVMDYLFERGNVGLATAAATSMLITVVAVDRAAGSTGNAAARPRGARHERDSDRCRTDGGPARLTPAASGSMPSWSSVRCSS